MRSNSIKFFIYELKIDFARKFAFLDFSTIFCTYPWPLNKIVASMLDVHLSIRKTKIYSIYCAKKKIRFYSLSMKFMTNTQQ